MSSLYPENICSPIKLKLFKRNVNYGCPACLRGMVVMLALTYIYINKTRLSPDLLFFVEVELRSTTAYVLIKSMCNMLRLNVDRSIVHFVTSSEAKQFVISQDFSDTIQDGDQVCYQCHKYLFKAKNHQ